MDERVRFVARLLDGEQTAGLCDEFGISRTTGYTTLARCPAPARWTRCWIVMASSGGAGVASV